MTKLITLFVSAFALSTSYAFAAPDDEATETPVKVPELSEFEAASVPLDKEAIIAKLEAASSDAQRGEDTAPETSDE